MSVNRDVDPVVTGECSQSETPLTDALIAKSKEETGGFESGKDVAFWRLDMTITHARQLERDLAAARKELAEVQKQRHAEMSGYLEVSHDREIKVDQLQARLDRAIHDLESGFMQGTYARLSNLQAAERERDELKAKLDRAVGLIPLMSMCMGRHLAYDDDACVHCDKRIGEYGCYVKDESKAIVEGK